MTFTEQISQAMQIANAIPPQTVNGATVNGTGVNTKSCQRWIALFNVGAVTGGGSLVGNLQSSATLAGSYANISGLATVAVTTSNNVAVLEIGADSMPSGQPFLRASFTEGGGQNVVADAILIGMVANYSPASQNNASNVATPIVVS
jgi:hypothetical protein